MILLTGTLLAHGRRTVAAALRHSGQERETSFSTFHHVLNRARWSPLAVSRQLLTTIVETFVEAGGTLELVIDETLERRWGPKISKRGHYRDSALSSRKRAVSSPGLRWIVMAVIVTLPWTNHRCALPFLCVLTTTPEVSAALGKRHKTVGMWARHMVKLVRRWCPTLPITRLRDTAYSILELGLECQEQQVSLLTPFHLDAVLHEPPPERDAHTIGRPRVVGSRLPSLEQILADPNTTWQRLTLEWYGQGERTLEICTGTALSYRAGFAPLPIRSVLTRDPLGKRPPKALFSTNQGLTTEQIVRTCMHRWSLETTFEESRAHLGIETQRQWSDLAIDRTTPLLFVLSSLVTLFGCSLHPEGCIPVTQTAWYHKHTATFHDVLAEVRRHFWGNGSFSTSPTDPDVVLVPCLTLDRLTRAVCY